MYVAQADLEIFFSDISKYGLDIPALILKGEEDVINYYKYIWWPSAYSDFLGGSTLQDINTNANITPELDVAFLNTTILKNLFLYRILGFYTFPSLMKTADEAEDSFYSRALYFQEKYEAEIAALQSVPMYDFNKDSVFSNVDLTSAQGGRPTIRISRG